MTRLRPMAEADADAVLAVQRAAYPPSHWEGWAVLGRKLALWPAGCWVAVDETDTVQAYLFSHPGRANAPPPLHGVLDALPDAPDAYAVHDLALHPRAQGQGLGARLWQQALASAQAAGLRTLSLVAVQGSAGFWQRQGFVPVEPSELNDLNDPDAARALVDKLASYGADAVFMHRAGDA